MPQYAYSDYILSNGMSLEGTGSSGLVFNYFTGAELSAMNSDSLGNCNISLSDVPAMLLDSNLILYNDQNGYFYYNNIENIVK